MENININFILSVILFVHTFKSSAACNGYQLKVNHIQNCNPNNIIRLINVSVALDNNCNLIPSGCMVVTKPFETAVSHYVINKPPLPPMEGDMDLCETLKNTQSDVMKSMLNIFQLPNHCPVAAGRICSNQDKKINLSTYKNRLALAAGNFNLKLNLVHNNGISCFDISTTLERPHQG